MLVLSRTIDESLTIIDAKTGDRIADIMVTKILTGGRVKLGITASRRYQVYRTEKLEEMLRPLPETPTEYETSIEDYGVNHAG